MTWQEWGKNYGFEPDEIEKIKNITRIVNGRIISIKEARNGKEMPQA